MTTLIYFISAVFICIVMFMLAPGICDIIYNIIIVLYINYLTILSFDFDFPLTSQNILCVLTVQPTMYHIMYVK